VIVDDAKLLQLAARRPKDAFPILERATSLSPLLLLLTFLPGIVALDTASLSERSAQWQLRAFEISRVPSLFDAVDPAASSDVSVLKYQPPLGTWLWAALDRWLPFDSRSLPLFEYFSAASLIPACYLFMSRLAGRRVGFITAALAAFHGTFLQQYRSAGPHALAVSASLLAFWGFFGHVWLATEIVSIDLLIGGLSLGVCLLAGGPLALAVVVILLLVSLAPIEPFVDAGRGRSAPTPRGRRLWSTWHGARSLGVMAATAFAAGGWWELMMLYSYGRAFGSAWLFAIPETPTGALPLRVPLFSVHFVQRFAGDMLSANGALAGLTVLGLSITCRRLLAPADGQSRMPFRFLAVWMAMSCVIFAGAESVSGTGSGGESLYIDLWKLFFSAACVCTAAVALDQVTRRKVGLFEFVCLTLATLGCGYAFLRTDNLVPNASMRGVFIALAAALLVARATQEVCRRSEFREWLLIVGLLSSCVLSDAGLGIASLQASDPDYESLLAFRKSLLPDKVDVEACLLVGEGQPPARLQFVLSSIWPKARIYPVKGWDEALKIAGGDGHTPKTAVVVDWSRGNSRPANPTGARWNAPPIGNPQFFEQRPLRAYVLAWE
jgi:hypothetical protein